MHVTNFIVDEILSSVGFKLVLQYFHSLSASLQCTHDFRKMSKIPLWTAVYSCLYFGPLQITRFLVLLSKELVL